MQGELVEAGPGSGLPWLVDALGEKDFEPRLMRYLNDICGADHCSIWEVTEREPLPVCAISLDGSNLARRNSSRYLLEGYWKIDDLFSDARRNFGRSECSIRRNEVKDIHDSRFRREIYAADDIVERVRVTGCRAHTTVSLSLLRSEAYGHFSEADLYKLEAASPLLLSLLCKHAAFFSRKVELPRVLSDLEFVEHTLASSSEPLPKRESQVVARILFGMSTLGISLELGISEETVMTYRKRVYNRLAIGSQRELLLWYLGQLNDVPRSPQPLGWAMDDLPFYRLATRTH